jgi:hypothetical protein
MVRKSVSAAVTVALCLMSASQAVAQEYRFTGFDPPQGATATVNLRVPIGDDHRRQPTYGLTFGYGYDLGGPNMNGRTMTRSVQLADFRFRGDQLQNARVASFDLANLDQDRRLNFQGDGSDNTWLYIGGAVVAGLVICLLAECFEGDDDDEDDPVVNPL